MGSNNAIGKEIKRCARNIPFISGFVAINDHRGVQFKIKDKIERMIELCDQQNKQNIALRLRWSKSIPW